MASIKELSNELQALAEECAVLVDGQSREAFEGRTFEVHSMDEIEAFQGAGMGFPMAVVSFEEAEEADSANRTDGRQGGSRMAGKRAVEIRFSIVVAVDYNNSAMVQSGGVDTKFVATDLLDALREKILGYQKVNPRPWRLIRESPAPSTIEGVIMYAQLWATTTIT